MHTCVVPVFGFSFVLLVAPVKAGEPMKVTADLSLPAGAVLETPLLIEADNVTIDGQGATIQGPGKPGELATFKGAGVLADGHSGVTIRNLTVRGFECGLVAGNGERWLIENCDFSDNYHDPEFGWGDGERNGGMILTNLHDSVIRTNKASRVWNGLDLQSCNDNRIEGNDFSHCSNVCLKMWNASRNVVRDNDLSYGIRIRPGEVHARDSTCVLIESGSNDNRFERNDITHGGDGIFIRPLNAWVSTGNVFIENDCSYANNNGVESWSPGNTFIRNKANHSSFGFWLGGSDHTVLLGNEASHNGLPTGHHNAPEPDFRHGGIVIVGGPGSHTLIDGNVCRHNNGAGIVFRGDLPTQGEKWKSYNMVVQNNVLEENEWGLFARFIDGLFLADNRYRGNKQDELIEAVANLHRGKPDPENQPAPKAMLEGPERGRVGEPVVFDASSSRDELGRPLTYFWSAGGKGYQTPRVEHVFTEPGFHRVYVTVSNGYLARPAFINFYCTSPGDELGTEGHARQWEWEMANNAGQRGKVQFEDSPDSLIGRKCLQMRPDPYMGAEVSAVLPCPQEGGWDLRDKTGLTFWLKFHNPNNGGFQGPNPIVRLHDGKSAYTYLPAYQGNPRNLLNDLPHAEARYGWLRVEMPLEGSPEWIRSESFDGEVPPYVSGDLKFETVNTPMATQDDSSLVSTPAGLFCAMREGDRLFRSTDGRQWQPVAGPAETLAGSTGDWQNGMLAYWAGGGAEGTLILRRREAERNAHGEHPARYICYDLARKAWRWTKAYCTPSHGTTVLGDSIYGLAHAVGGNYGGPVTHLDLTSGAERDDRTVLDGLEGEPRTRWWFSRAAKLAALDGKIYGIKNDWTTPQPPDKEQIGDRLFVFNPGDYQPSDFQGDNVWQDTNWTEARTPVTDLGPLPFEVGHGSALVPLPADWCPVVGRHGGLFIVAGCSPSNHEGFGQPSDQYAIYDIDSGRFTLGRLPDKTGAGTSAAMHQGRLFIKRGGLNYGPTNDDLWIVCPIAPDQAEATARTAEASRMSLEKVDRLTIQFDSIGHAPFTIWIDGLRFE